MKTQQEKLLELYTKAEKAWIKTMKIEEGSTVRVVSLFKSEQGGCDIDPVEQQKKQVGKTLKVSTIYGDNEGCSIRLEDGYYYPYFCLEPVEAEEMEWAGLECTLYVDGSAEIGCSSFTKEEIDQFIARRQQIMG